MRKQIQVQIETRRKEEGEREVKDCIVGEKRMESVE